MTPYAGRTIDHGRPVEVYRNLNRGGYSVRQAGLVVAHAEELALANCTMHVSEAGRQRVVKTNRKCVHAFIRGFISPEQEEWGKLRQLKYCPFKWKEFVNESGKPVRQAKCCVFAKQVFYGV